MSAGQPDWQKLHDMGKLPAEHRDKIPGLKEADSIKEQLCDDCKERIFGEKKEEQAEEIITLKCEVEGCEFVTNPQSERLAHRTMKSHITREHTPNTPE